ncbi:MAG: GntR family transcriptional regulator [Acidimicrobiia bacterium]|nr:GntR family transcriptional regulator [Acidimicrobiia bacterium]
MTTYLALADSLEVDVRKAVPGSRVPSEHELVDLHGISRLTARAALQELERRHLVRRVRGAGTFVARRIEYRIAADTPPSWSETVRRAGGVPRNELLATEVVAADGEVADALGLAPGAPVVRVDRRGWVDGEQAGISSSHFPADRFTDLPAQLVAGDGCADGTTCDTSNGIETSSRHADSASLYTTLVEHYRVSPRRAWSTAELDVLAPEAASLLGLSGRPLAWWLLSCNHDGEGRPIEFARSWLRTDVFKVVFRLEAAS